MRAIGIAIIMLMLLSITGVYAFDLDKFDKDVPRDEKKETPDMVGAAVVTYKSPYRGESVKVIGIPVIFWEQDKFFIRDFYAGYIVAQTDELEFNVNVAPRLMGYDASETGSLNGMQDRDWSLDGGAELIWTMPQLYDTAVSLSFAGDLTSEHEGYEISMKASKRFDFEPFFIKPAISVEYQSKDLTDYYYGVRPAEATGTRPAYSADDAVNFSTSIDFYMALSEEWLLISRIKATFLDDPITDSPIVDEDTTLLGLVGLTRMF